MTGLDLTRPSVEVAPLLLGAVLHGRGVSVRLTELEAYLGEADPGSHAFRGRTRRNAVMYGPPGRLYAYFTYGMHVCANVVCSPEGEATAVLLRAGEVIDGLELARSRRSTSRGDADLARGPARLCVALGIRLDDDGAELVPVPRAASAGSAASPGAAAGELWLEPPVERVDPARVRTGPRTGVSGIGGSEAYPWRFWIDGDPTVSPYKRHAPKRRAIGLP